MLLWNYILTSVVWATFVLTIVNWRRLPDRTLHIQSNCLGYEYELQCYYVEMAPLHSIWSLRGQGVILKVPKST